MAILSDTQRREVWAQWMQANAETVSIAKGDLRAAADALDQFLEDNAATVNAAIPQPARGALSNAQKARLLAYVTLKRWGGN